jgi:iron(III) transport system permease protein
LAIGLPLVVLILGSFNRLFGFFFVDGPWTSLHWKEVLTDSSFSQAAWNSIWLAVSAGLIGTFMYALIAWVLARTKIWGRELIALLVWLPWAIPGVVLGVALLSIVINTPILSSLYGTMVPLIIAMVIKDMPLGVQMLRTAVHQVSVEFEQAAEMSGAGFGTIFWRITVPLIAPMMSAVFLLSFMATLRDVSALVLLASPGTRTLSLLMYEYATTSRLEAAAVLGVIMAVISLIVTTIVSRLSLKMSIE